VQVFLVGDPVQLPATVISSRAVEHGYDKSLFKRLQSSGFPVQASLLLCSSLQHPASPELHAYLHTAAPPHHLDYCCSRRSVTDATKHGDRCLRCNRCWTRNTACTRPSRPFLLPSSTRAACVTARAPRPAPLAPGTSTQCVPLTPCPNCTLPSAANVTVTAQMHQKRLSVPSCSHGPIFLPIALRSNLLQCQGCCILHGEHLLPTQCNAGE
jgi:hypothetical protein